MLTLFDTTADEPREPAVHAAGDRERRRASEAGEPVFTRIIDSPLGPLFAAATDRGVRMLEFGPESDRAVRHLDSVCGAADEVRPEGGSHPVLEHLSQELAAYFAGFLEEFAVPLSPVGTEFQRRVWTALRAIPCGQTRSYAQVAARIGRATATRAVANANGANRIAIVIPCHRVVGSDGSLTGYGGGLDRKDWLLRHEQEVTSLFSPAQLAAIAH